MTLPRANSRPEETDPYGHVDLQTNSAQRGGVGENNIFNQVNTFFQ